MSDYAILAIIIGAPRVDAERLAELLRAPDMQALRALIVELTPPWWQSLLPRVPGADTWDRVRPIRDGVPVTHGDGRLWRNAATTKPDGSPVIWDVYDVDLAGERIMVLDVRPGFPAGLYVRVADCALADKGEQP